MSELHEVALRAGVFQVVEREAKAAKDQAKADLVKMLPFGDTVAGRVGDDVLCKAGWSKGSKKAVVVDEAAFLAWVKEHHPTEIVESVNSAYQSSLKPVGDVVIDADGLPVDGMEVVTGNPSLSVRSEKDALTLVQQLIEDGRVSLGAIKELAPAPVHRDGCNNPHTPTAECSHVDWDNLNEPPKNLGYAVIDAEVVEP